VSETIACSVAGRESAPHAAETGADYPKKRVCFGSGP